MIRAGAYAATAAAAVSFFAESVSIGVLGLPGAMLVAGVAVLLPELLHAVVVPVAFRPDVIIAVDPLDPDPGMLAQGIRKALRRCADDGRPMRMLIARVPGCDVTLAFNAVRRFVDVSVVRKGGREAARQSRSVLPAFLPGEAPAWWVMGAGGDNVRLRWVPGAKEGDALRCERPAVGGAWVALAALALAVGVWAVDGWRLALLTVAPFVGVRLIEGVVTGFSRTGAMRDAGMCIPGSEAPRWWGVLLAATALIVFNLRRLALV